MITLVPLKSPGWS